MQRCLKALRETSDQIGVFIAGMGGLGKSSLAARLCTRVQTQRSNFARVVLIGSLDEIGLLNKLSNKFERFADVPALLNEPKVSLKGRLQNFFEAIENEHKQPLLLVLDDFEQNIPIANVEDGSLRMTAEAYEILGAICAALAETGAESRLIVTCRYLKADTFPPHRLHLESLAGMNSSDIDKICFPLDQEVRQQLRTQRIIDIADGNPRLLKWLLEVIQQPGLAADELLNTLEATEQKFRENILAQTLLDALELEEQKFLAQLSVFHLPVTVEIINAISPSASFLQKLTSLSLVESATTHLNQPANYRVTTILEPLLETVLSEEEWQVTRQQGVRKLYQIWFQKPGCIEYEVLEMVRLGLLVREREIAISAGNSLATTWLKQFRYLETFELCQQILAVFQDYTILSSIAYAEGILGLPKDALAHYQQALDLCPKDDLEEKALILNNMAKVISNEGEIEQALQFYEQSLEIADYIGNTKIKSAIFTNMAWIIAQQGNSERALKLYQQSLEIKESLDDVRGKAGTLNDMASFIAEQGDIKQALQLWQQSLEITKHIGDIDGEAATLANMASFIAEQGDIEQSLQLWQQSLEIDEGVGNLQGRAATLWNMAYYIYKNGDLAQALQLWKKWLEIDDNIKRKAITLPIMIKLAGEISDQARQLELYLQAAEVLVQTGSYESLVNVLGNLGLKAESNCSVYFAQAIWLSLKIKGPLANTINLISHFYGALPTGDKLQPLLLATAIFLYNSLEPNHPHLDQLDKLINWMIQGVKTRKAKAIWFVKQRLNEPEYFLPRLNQRLEEIVGDGWLFDCSQFEVEE